MCVWGGGGGGCHYNDMDLQLPMPNPNPVVAMFKRAAISAYHHERCVFESRSWQGVLNTILCDKVCQ